MSVSEVATIVEGHGDLEAVSILIRKVAESLDASRTVKMPIELRSSKGRMRNEQAFLKSLEIVRRYVGSGGSVLVIMDADKDCPKEINEQLTQWAKKAHADLSVAVVVAKREMEAWFIAGSAHWNKDEHGDAESVRDPKNWVAKNIVKGHYAETVDQARMAANLDIEKAREARSFGKFARDVTRLLSKG